MIQFLLFVLLSINLPFTANAAMYWVSQAGGVSGVNGNCSQIVGDTDPGAYMTPYGEIAADCAGSGDTVIFKAVIYTGAAIKFNQLFTANGTPLAPNKVLCENDRGCDLRTSQTFGVIVWIENANNFQFGQDGFGFTITCNPGVVVAPFDDCGAIGNRITSGGGVISNVRIEGNHLRGCTVNCYNETERQPVDYFTNTTFRKNRVEALLADLSTTGDPHPVYISSDSALIEYNDVDASMNYALHDYHMCFNSTWRYNKVTHGPSGIGFTCRDNEQMRSTNTKFYGNTLKWTGAANAGVCMKNGNADGPFFFYNNVCDGHNVFMAINTGSLGTFKNNLCTNGNCIYQTCTNAGSCATTTTPLTLDCGGASRGLDCQTNNPVVTAASHFKDAANQDYSLIAGSSLINAGISTGGLVVANGTPDRGAHETFTCTLASINTNVLDLTCSMAGYAPVNPVSGVTGWSISCTVGVNCGTPVISNVTVPTGSSTLLRFTLTGLGGGSNACEAGQTWKLTYNSATGNVRDSHKIGWVSSAGSQHLHSFTDLAVTNACTGGGTPPPGGLHIHYKLDDGTSGATPTTANDETVNNLDGTLIGGATWAAGRYGSGVSLTSTSGQAIQIPYGNGLDLDTQSLTIAFGVNVIESQIPLNKSYFGAFFTSGRLLYVTTKSSTWQVGVHTSGDSTPSGPSDLAVQAGWNRVCLQVNSATNTVTLYVNGVASAAPQGVKTYGSGWTLPGDLELGRIGNVSTGGGGVFDEFKLWTSVASCADDYLAWEPVTSPWTGTISVASVRFYAAKTNASGALIPYAAVDTNITVPAGAAFTVAVQTDGTAADPSQISERLYYACATCPSAGEDLPVPNVATTDGIEFWGLATETGLLLGDHGARLSGALTYVPGGTLVSADAVPVFDLAQNNSIVNRWILRIVPGTAQGRQFCFKPREQSGIVLDSYTPAGGACVTVGPPVAHGGP